MTSRHYTPSFPKKQVVDTEKTINLSVSNFSNASLFDHSLFCFLVAPTFQLSICSSSILSFHPFLFLPLSLSFISLFFKAHDQSTILAPSRCAVCQCTYPPLPQACTGHHNIPDACSFPQTAGSPPFLWLFRQIQRVQLDLMMFKMARGVPLLLVQPRYS